jgi:hypothetical protein
MAASRIRTEYTALLQTQFSHNLIQRLAALSSGNRLFLAYYNVKSTGSQI